MQTLKDLQVTLPFFMNRCWVLSVSDSMFLYSFVFYKLIISKSYILCIYTVSYNTNWYIPNRIFADFICLSSPKANNWTAICDGNNNRLSIGEFSFMKKGLSSYTEANNARDVIAMLYLLSFFHLEDYHVMKVHSTVTDTAILRIKMSSHPPVNGQPININSVGCVNKKLCRFIIGYFSLQVVFNNWYGTPSLLKWLLHLMQRWLLKTLWLPSNATRWFLSLCACALHLTTTFTLISVKMELWVGTFLLSNNCAPPVLDI